jgi:hypothetical protein
MSTGIFNSRIFNNRIFNIGLERPAGGRLKKREYNLDPMAFPLPPTDAQRREDFADRVSGKRRLAPKPAKAREGLDDEGILMLFMLH